MAKAPANRTKADTLSLRVAPDLKFGLELLAKIEDRSLTTIVERSLRSNFYDKIVPFQEFGKLLDPRKYPEIRYSELLNLIWSVDGPTRLFRTVIALPGAITVKDISLIELITENSYFDGDDQVRFACEGSQHAELLSNLADIFWESSQGVNLDRVRRNWTRLNEMVDEAFTTGHYPESPTWE